MHKRRLLSILLTFAMLVSMTPALGGMAMAAEAVNWSGAKSVTANETISDIVTLAGDTTLTIASGATLTVNNTINCYTYALTVDGGGTLIVKGADSADNSGVDGGAGVGVSVPVTLAGGEITAAARRTAALSPSRRAWPTPTARTTI